MTKRGSKNQNITINEISPNKTTTKQNKTLTQHSSIWGYETNTMNLKLKSQEYQMDKKHEGMK